MVTTRPTTVEDVEALPDDGYRYDVIEGVLHRMSPANFEHGELAHDLGRWIGNHVERHRLGRVVAAETGFVLRRDPLTLLGPDVAFVRADRLPPRAARRHFLEIPPDLAVEVVSPSESRTEIEDKVAKYLAAGVPMIWLLYPMRKVIAVHRPGREPRMLGIDDVLDGEDILPGFRLPVADIFREEP